MTKKLLATFMLIILACASMPQEVLPGSLYRFESEISVGEAAYKATRVLRILKLSDVKPNETTAMLRNFQSHGRFWEIADKLGRYVVGISAQSGLVVSFTNYEARTSQFKRRPTGKRKFRTEADEKKNLRELAKAFGLPNDCTIVKFQKVEDGQAIDGMPHGYIAAFIGDSKGKILASLEVDLEEGNILNFARHS